MSTLFRIMPIVAAAGVAAAPVSGQTASALLRENDLLAEGVVTTINNPATNHAGGYGVGITTDGATSRFWGSADGGAGAVLRSEMLIGDYDQTAFESFWGLADGGLIAYSPTATNIVTGSVSLDCVFIGDGLVMAEELPVDGRPGFFWSFGSRPGTTADGTPYFVGGWAVVKGGATQVRGLFYGPDATPVYLNGDAVCDLPLPIGPGSAIDFDYRYSASGKHHLVPVNMDAPTAADGTLILDGCGLLIDGALVREGSPVPAAAGGLPGENWDNFDSVGVNDAGDWFFTGDTDADAAVDEIIVKNGVIIVREGDVVDGATIGGAMESAYMNDDGDIAYVWDVSGGALEALLLNDMLLLTEGDAVDFDGDGILDPGTAVTNFTGIASLAISDRIGGAVDVYFTADVQTKAGVLEGFFRITVEVEGEPCEGDLDDDGDVDVNDLLELLGSWGVCGVCPADLDGDGDVDVNDLLTMLGNWGPCP